MAFGEMQAQISLIWKDLAAFGHSAGVLVIGAIMSIEGATRLKASRSCGACWWQRANESKGGRSISD